jgi:hypothetical protein
VLIESAVAVIFILTCALCLIYIFFSTLLIIITSHKKERKECIFFSAFNGIIFFTLRGVVANMHESNERKKIYKKLDSLWPGGVPTC